MARIALVASLVLVCLLGVLPASGSPVGENFGISDHSADWPPQQLFQTAAGRPDVAHDQIHDRYLVVWSANTEGIGAMTYDFEIWGQLLDAGGAEIGDDFQISSMGAPGPAPADYDAYGAAVTWRPSSTGGEFLVVWFGDDTTPGNDDLEIWGRRLGPDGTQIGTDDFRISDAGVDGNPASAAIEPDVVYNSTAGEYFVTWMGDDPTNVPPTANDESEIWGQRLRLDGTQVGPNDLRISEMGPLMNPAYDAYWPAVAYNPSSNQYLVTWEGDTLARPLSDEQFEIFGQVLTASGSQTGKNDFRISAMGKDGSKWYNAQRPSVAHNPTANQYLVAWHGNDDNGQDQEIYGQRLTAAGGQVGADDFQISDMGSGGAPGQFIASSPSVTFNPVSKEYLVVWDGWDDTPPLVLDEAEIFGQQLTSSGVEIPSNDFRISYTLPDGDSAYDVDAFYPAGVHNSVSNRYLVVWLHDRSILPDVFSVSGQLLTPAGN